MRTRTPLLALLAVAALGALAGPAAAAPTETRITSPVDPAFITYPATGAASLAVTGTSNGKTDKLDVRCDGTVALLLKANVTPNAAGSFGTTISAATMAKLAGQSCVLRAVPANHISTSSHFAGVRLLISDLTLGSTKSGTVINYRVRAPQLAGRGVYGSVGTCGIEGAATFSSGYTTSADVFTCAARLANTIGARSAIQVDGANAFTPAGAATLFSTPTSSSSLPGLAPLTVTVTSDPATGNLTIRESEIIVKCTPDSTTWPVNPATCTSFTPSGVRLDRTVTQAANGRLASVIDSWTSTDGKPHKIDTVYENASTGGAAFQFPWIAATYMLPSTAYLVPPSPSAPFTYFTKYASAGDNDTHHDQGATVVQLSPEAMAFKSSTSLWVQENRTVPQTGALTVGFAYIWGASGAEISAAAAAVQPTLATPCVVPRALNQTIAEARDTFRRSGCQLGTTSKQPSTKFKKFKIKAQTSKTGATVPNGTKINVTVSSGAPKKK
jgi:PASTA domain